MSSSTLAAPRAGTRRRGSRAITVRGLGKSYTIAHNQERHTTAAEALLHRLKNPLQRSERETFWALKDVSFEIEKGDVVGVVGRNGAGKSTLLKVLSRITEPTCGEVDLYGRVGSLLEVGTGFHAELTGRENIYLNGAILGMTRREIEREFDAIVEFSGTERFLDTPVKRYSSGMYVRLAFAVAAHLRSEILIVDEVLAVGDAEFQKKCLGKMKDVATGGRTVLFVSHHMQSVANLCTSGLFLSGGRVEYHGSVGETVHRYIHSFRTDAGGVIETSDPDLRFGSGELRVKRARPEKFVFGGGEPKEVVFDVERRRPFPGKFSVSLHLYDEHGIRVVSCDSRLLGRYFEPDQSLSGRVVMRSPWLKPGNYRVDVSLIADRVIDRFEGACYFEVSPLLPYPDASHPDAIGHAVTFGDFDLLQEPAAHRALPGGRSEAG